ncbi:MAG: tRNA-dihydrouridine synthase family protein [Eubacterium sp.]|nr:tRNA-dihydrouridine synthase family protein [Eubacterium sp.]
MKPIYLAPLEGVTDNIYRNTFLRYYGGVAKMFTPFLSPCSTHKFTTRETEEIDPARNDVRIVVPQIIANSSEHFLWAAGEIIDRGFGEINFNLGCPSGTVVPKKKGSGLLFFPDLLDRILYDIFAALPSMCPPSTKSGVPDADTPGTDIPDSATPGTNIPGAYVPAAGTPATGSAPGPDSSMPKISVKTRLGKEDPDEFYEILEIFNKYPISEITVHPRIQKDFYKEPIRPEYVDFALEHSKAPIVFNGEIKSVDDIRRVEAEHPGLTAIMLGRGLITNPELALHYRKISATPESTRSDILNDAESLSRMSSGDTAPDGHGISDADRFRAFHDDLLAQYVERLSGDKPVLHRMKEFWALWQEAFPGNATALKQIRKAKSVAEYRSASSRILCKPIS